MKFVSALAVWKGVSGSGKTQEDSFAKPPADSPADPPADQSAPLNFGFMRA